MILFIYSEKSIDFIFFYKKNNNFNVAYLDFHYSRWESNPCSEIESLMSWPLDEGNFLAGEIRIELILTGSKPVVLPLDDSPLKEVNILYIYQWNLLGILSNLYIDSFLNIFEFFLLNN